MPMPNEGSQAKQSAAEQIFVLIEQEMEPGGIRDLWWNIRKELGEGGVESVRTYLDAEYQRRKAVVESALNELNDQLEEIT